MKLIDDLVSAAPSIASIRRDIHAHPELCFEEQRTADLVATQLTQWGIPVHRGMGTTGVVGIVKAGSSDRAIGLRADMDALPMQEFTRRCCWRRPSSSPGRVTLTARCI
jgi:hippurate hydrolase